MFLVCVCFERLLLPLMLPPDISISLSDSIGGWIFVNILKLSIIPIYPVTGLLWYFKYVDNIQTRGAFSESNFNKVDLVVGGWKLNTDCWIYENWKLLSLQIVLLNHCQYESIFDNPKVPSAPAQNSWLHSLLCPSIPWPCPSCCSSSECNRHTPGHHVFFSEIFELIN